MKKLNKIVFILLFGIVTIHAATMAEATAFINEAAKLCKDKGNDFCFKEFSNKQGSFIRGNLYIFAYDFDGVNRAHGANPQIVGKNLYKIKDATGQLIVQEFIKIAKTKGEGWIDYKWSHPKTKKNTDKTSYIKRVDGDVIIGTSYYK